MLPNFPLNSLHAEDSMIWLLCALLSTSNLQRGGSRTAAASKIELFVMIANGFHPLTIITKNSILDIAAVLDPPLIWT